MNRARYLGNGMTPTETEPTVETANVQEVASFSSYPEAEAAVDALADDGFPVERLAIVAEGLRYVEDVTGRRGFPEAAIRGAASGAFIGALIGFFLGLFNVVEPLMSALIVGLWGLVLGLVLGAVFGLASMWFSAGRRNFDSVAAVRADRYVILSAAEVASDAIRLLGPVSRRT